MGWNMLFVFLPATVAGLIQATTGFGAGIFMMLFFPMFLPMIQCSALSSAIGLINTVTMAIMYRKYAQPKLIVLPAIIYFFFSTVCIWYSTQIDLAAFKPFFGLFLSVLGLYFLFFSQRIKLKGTWKSAAVCSSLSGIASGFFGIGGPPMVLYFLSLTGDDKYTYLGTLQLFFLITSIQGVATRALNGIYTPELLMLVPIGMLGSFIGTRFGTKIVKKLPVERLKVIIYAFLCLSGLATFITNL